jgi:prevent-host-death family protein
MAEEISVRDLRNNVSAVLRRVEAGERLRITVSGRPVAELTPLTRRRPSMSGTEWLQLRQHGRLADPGLLTDLRRL